MPFKIAAIYDNYIEAHIALGNLQNEYINCWLKDENTVAVEPGLTFAVGGIKLMVAETQYERAIELLENTKKRFRQSTPCPQCKSTNVDYISIPKKAATWWATILSIISNAGAAMPAEKKLHCFNCGKDFDLAES